MHIVERLGQTDGEVTELGRGGTGVAQEIHGVAEKAVRHAELDGFDLVGEAGDTAGSGVVGDELTSSPP
ncbi:hypothetical protein ACFY4H_27230 [Streptomyces althioticus]|uniref:hypothetical protein n=1 Tax=Streptomyces althioticus TaxID=83380 RepID=UPI00369C176A